MVIEKEEFKGRDRDVFMDSIKRETWKVKHQ